MSSYVNMIDAPLLKVTCPERSLVQLEPWVEPFKKTCTKIGATTLRRIAVFTSQITTECGLIPGRMENLNYSAQGLANTWPHRYAVNPNADVKVPNALAKSLHRKPEAIANNVYANRMGNGPPESGDGWRFRGQGPKQITGKANWAAFAKYMGMTIAQAMAYAATIEGGLMAAGWFWTTNNLNPLADTAGVEDETHRINGGYNGLSDRRTRTNNTIKEMIRRERLKK